MYLIWNFKHYSVDRNIFSSYKIHYTIKSRVWWATESRFAKLSTHRLFHDTSNECFITKAVFTKTWVIAYENLYSHLDIYVVAQHQFSFRGQETVL